jgi:hypothetical protein
MSVEALVERLSPAYTLVERTAAADAIQSRMSMVNTSARRSSSNGSNVLYTKQAAAFAQLEVAHDVVAAGAVLGLLQLAQGPQRDLNLMPDPRTPPDVLAAADAALLVLAALHKAASAHLKSCGWEVALTNENKTVFLAPKTDVPQFFPPSLDMPTGLRLQPAVRRSVFLTRCAVRFTVPCACAHALLFARHAVIPAQLWRRLPVDGVHLARMGYPTVHSDDDVTPLVTSSHPLRPPPCWGVRQLIGLSKHCWRCLRCVLLTPALFPPPPLHCRL